MHVPVLIQSLATFYNVPSVASAKNCTFLLVMTIIVARTNIFNAVFFNMIFYVMLAMQFPASTYTQRTSRMNQNFNIPKIFHSHI